MSGDFYDLFHGWMVEVGILSKIEGKMKLNILLVLKSSNWVKKMFQYILSTI